MDDFKTRFFAWYDQKFSAGWWRKSSMYAAAVGLLLPVILMAGQYATDNLPQISQVLNLTPFQTLCAQAFFAIVVVPFFAALKQKSVRDAVLKQAVKTGEITSEVDTAAVTIAVPGMPTTEVVPNADLSK